MKEMITRKEFADLLGVSTRTLDRYRMEEWFPEEHILPNGTIRFDKQEAYMFKKSIKKREESNGELD